ncbi:hypothetical protein [Paractinoplanes toevensis]|nr:hypothetical protein [Actinoplanes toevensis]
MPAQYRVRAYQQPQVLQRLPGEPAEQRCQPHPIDRIEPDLLLAELAVQHRKLVPQDENLGVLVAIAAWRSRSNANALVSSRPRCCTSSLGTSTMAR